MPFFMKKKYITIFAKYVNDTYTTSNTPYPIHEGNLTISYTAD